MLGSCYSVRMAAEYSDERGNRLSLSVPPPLASDEEVWDESSDSSTTRYSQVMEPGVFIPPPPAIGDDDIDWVLEAHDLVTVDKSDENRVEKIATAMRTEGIGVEVKARRKKLKKLPNCFVGSEAITWVVKTQDIEGETEAEQRRNAMSLCQEMMDKGVCTSLEGKPFLDSDKEFYVFEDTFQGVADESLTADQFAELREIAEEIRNPEGGVIVKDRRYRLTVYPQCFIGSELVDWIVENKDKDRGKAMEIGMRLAHAEVFAHVCGDHTLKDAYLFYRFQEDDESLLSQKLGDFSVFNIDREPVNLKTYESRVVLVVNTACLDELAAKNLVQLQTLYERYNDIGLTVIAFPCNQFGRLEPWDNAAIHDHLIEKYSITFPIMNKVEVNGPDAEPLWKWLRVCQKDGVGNSVKWNFTKFLIDRTGTVVERFAPNVAPYTFEREVSRLCLNRTNSQSSTTSSHA